MKQGDFSKLAIDYIHRPNYSLTVLQALGRYTQAGKEGFCVADVGAGTGKLTENLLELGYTVRAVEPNDSMRSEGMRLSAQNPRVVWQKGSGEITGLADASADWLLMGSSFHWTDHPTALKEFRRVLRPGGYFTAIWNPRHVERSEVEKDVEAIIQEHVPQLKRVSSGSKTHTKDWTNVLMEDGLFKDVLFTEAPHHIAMTKERYLGVWRSVNDIQAQAGPERFEKIMQAIEKRISHLPTVNVPYHTRAWTVRAA